MLACDRGRGLQWPLLRGSLPTAFCLGALAISVLAHFFDVALVHRFVYICAVHPWISRRFGNGNPRHGSEAEALPVSHFESLRPGAKLFLTEFVHHAKVTSRDCDLMGHMNNARYPREADFARHKLFVACGLFDVCWREKMPLVTAAQSIRYRRELRHGTQFQIRTRVVGWDASSIFLEQAFCVRCPKTDGFEVHAILVVKETVAVGTRRKAALPRPLAEAMCKLGWVERSQVDCAEGGVCARPGFLAVVQQPPPDISEWALGLIITSARVNDRLGHSL